MSASERANIYCYYFFFYFFILSVELPWDQPTSNCAEFLAWKENKYMTLTPWTKLDSLAIALLRKVLAVTPTDRITLDKLQQHRWCQNELIGKSPFFFFLFYFILYHCHLVAVALAAAATNLSSCIFLRVVRGGGGGGGGAARHGTAEIHSHNTSTSESSIAVIIFEGFFITHTTHAYPVSYQVLSDSQW